MKLYHGTNEATALRALAEGLKPRGERPSVWENVPSREDLVYLTVAYAPYFAMCAATSDEGPREKWAVIEIDTDLLEESNFAPDEDFLEQATRGQDLPGLPPDSFFPDASLARTAWFREHMMGFQHLWQSSLDNLGNCAYQGEIPESAISRVTVFDPESHHALGMMAMDPSISLLNYRFCGPKYQALTRWFSGYRVEAADLDPISATFGRDPKAPTGMRENFERLVAAVQDRACLTVLKGDF